MRREEAELIRAQLIEAMGEAGVEPMELAALAGMLARLCPDDALVHDTRAALSDIPELVGAAEDALNALLEVDEGDDPAEAWDALCAFDELCAAATLLGACAALARLAEECAAAVSAFPEPWAPHAAAAAEVLRDRPPLPGDPAAGLWAAVEASRWAEGVAPRADEMGAPGNVRIRLGLDLFFSLGSLSPPHGVALAAADPLPRAPAYRDLARGEGWELAVTEDDIGRLVLLLSVEGSFSRDGMSVSATRTPDGWQAPASPGAWTIEVVGQVFQVRIDP